MLALENKRAAENAQKEGRGQSRQRGGNKLTHLCEIELRHRLFDNARTYADGHELDLHKQIAEILYMQSPAGKFMMGRSIGAPGGNFQNLVNMHGGGQSPLANKFRGLAMNRSTMAIPSASKMKSSAAFLKGGQRATLSPMAMLKGASTSNTNLLNTAKASEPEVTEIDLSTRSGDEIQKADKVCFLVSRALTQPAKGKDLELDLSHNLIGFDCQDGLFKLANILHHLVLLDISHCHLGRNDRQTGTAALAEALPDTNSLTVLNVSHNSLCKGSVSGSRRGQGGLVTIAKGIQKNSSLRVVDLSHNLPTTDVFHTAGFGSRCVFAFSAALKENSSIETLDLRGNKLTKIEQKALERAKKNNLKLYIHTPEEVHERGHHDDYDDD